MILCITPNPALDRTLIVPGFRVGQVIRPKETMVAAGGKGLNVARGIRILGGQAVCMGPLGGHTGRLFADLAQQEGLDGLWAWTEAETRTCTIIVNPERGEATGIYEAGAPLSTQDWAQMVSDVIPTAGRAEAITISGSLPSGLPPAALGDMIGTLRSVNPTVWLDSSGEALAAGVAAQPTGLKINAEEAEGLLHRPINDIHAACEAAQELHERGISMVVLTLGQLGAVLAAASGQWWAWPPASHAINPVGSGDVFLAGLTIALTRGRMPGEALCHGVAAGSANARSTGGGRFTASDFEAVLHETVVQRMPCNDRPNS